MQRFAKQYRQQGYCVIPGLVPRRLCTSVLKSIDAVFASQLRALKLSAAAYKGQRTLHANMQKLFKADVNAYLAAARHSS